MSEDPQAGLKAMFGIEPDMPIEDMMNRVFEDKAASFWLKTALAEAVGRDPIDAANDATILASILTLRADTMLRRAGGLGRD